MESSTKILRRILDERGVEYVANDGEYVKETCWPYMGELTAAFAEYYDGTTRFACDTWCFTPAQAIAATLGATDARPTQAESSGTCQEVMINRHWRGCGECGYVWENMYGEGFQIGPNYCPMCGAKVVD